MEERGAVGEYFDIISKGTEMEVGRERGEEVIDKYEKQEGTTACALWNTGRDEGNRGVNMTVYHDRIGTVTQEISKPVNNKGGDTKRVEFGNKKLVIDLIKGFLEVEQYNIKGFVRFEDGFVGRYRVN